MVEVEVDKKVEGKEARGTGDIFNIKPPHIQRRPGILRTLVCRRPRGLRDWSDR